MLVWSNVTVPAPFNARPLAMRYPDAPSVSEVELVIEIVLFVAVSGELTATTPP